MAKNCDRSFEMQRPILLAEDYLPDAEAVQRSFKKQGVTIPIFVVPDGVEAIAYLKGEGIYADRAKFPLPGMLLLDLKMPRRSGLQVLEWCNTQVHLKDMLIVVLSGYRELKEVARAYELGASTFFTKPLNDDDIVNLAERFRTHWDRPPLDEP